MDARALLEGHARAGSWMAIAVDLTNAGPPSSGELRIAGGAPEVAHEVLHGRRPADRLSEALPTSTRSHPSFGGKHRGRPRGRRSDGRQAVGPVRAPRAGPARRRRGRREGRRDRRRHRPPARPEQRGAGHRHPRSAGPARASRGLGAHSTGSCGRTSTRTSFPATSSTRSSAWLAGGGRLVVAGGTAGRRSAVRPARRHPALSPERDRRHGAGEPRRAARRSCPRRDGPSGPCRHAQSRACPGDER